MNCDYEYSFFYFSHTWYKCKVSVRRNFAALLFLWQLKKLTVYACQESTKWCLFRLFHVLRTWQNWTKWYYYKHAGFWIASLKISSCLWALYLCLLYFTSLYYGCRWEYLIWWLREFCFLCRLQTGLTSVCNCLVTCLFFVQTSVHTSGWLRFKCELNIALCMIEFFCCFFIA